MTAVLKLQGVSKSYDGYKVVDDFCLRINQGELRCLLGPNGAGKTTTIDLITGRQRVSSGTILFRGQDITRSREHEIARLGIGRKFQIPAVFKDLTVRENLEVASNLHTSPFVNATIFRQRYDQRRFEEVVELIGLRDRLEDKAGVLSHGETQWLEMGMVLTQNPKLLLMDEPTAGMTEQEMLKTSQIFNSLKGSHSLVVVEHDMSFVREIADIITVMHMGRTLAEGPLREVERNPQVKEVYLGAEGISRAH